jgi:uncharacterized protein (DUF169 family)
MDQKQQHEWLMRTLGLQTPPVAVKFIKEWSEDAEWDLADKGYYRPKAPLNVCQFIGQARHHGRKVVATPEDQVCNVGALVTGAYPYDDMMKQGEIAKKDGARKTPELCEAMFQTLPRLPFGEAKAIAFAPFDKMDLGPDQIIVYGTPLQILKLIQGYVYAHEPRFTMSTCAKYGVCVEGIALAYTTGKPSVSFPCRGERVSSIVQDQELTITLPYALLPEVIEGFEKTKHLLPSPIPFGGVDADPTFLPDHYLTPHAKKRRG